MAQQIDHYQDGMDACADGLYETACPHADGSARVQWLRGFRDFMPIREEWESDLYSRAQVAA